MTSVFCAEKPYGISSHQTDLNKPGFVEWLTVQKQQSVFLCHRLDKTTTGCFVATTSSDDCAHVSKMWMAGEVQKVYWFLTDKKPSEQKWTVSSWIEKKEGRWTSDVLSKKPNASTEFRVLKNEAEHFLIEARPLTGKTHQIRLHAQQSQVSLLGDTLYGGTKFPLMFLHCREIQSTEFKFESQPPEVYQNLTLLKNPLLCQWLMSYDRRQRLYPELLSNNQCLRLIHNEGTPLRVDLLGSVAHAGWWHETPPTKAEQDSIDIFFEMMTIRSWSLQNYGKQRQLENKFFIDKAPESWLAEENGLTYEFTKSIGAAPGLFLDQREHRKWIQKNSANKRILNLFAYTGGFSLNAAKGGASEVVTVDLSPKYKEWAQKNFSLNQLSSPSFKFYDMDSFDYLLYAKKKGLQFDIILCDPPSFSRSKKGQFQIDRDYGKLLEMSLAVLAPGGELLFSTNYEQWNASQWMQKIRINKTLQALEIKDNFSMQWDFDWHTDNAQMKAFHLRKK